MPSDRLASELYDTEKGKLAFIIGRGPSIKNAEKHLSQKLPNVFTIAINKAIETVPADYWFWMDLDAYQASKDHPHAQAAKKLGVDRWQKEYDPDVYMWVRAGNPDKIGESGRRDFYRDVFRERKLAWNGVSAVGAASLAWQLGAYRMVFVGCENKDTDGYIDRRAKEDPSKNWPSIYAFTFARVAEAMVNRFAWMHPKVMMVDASHTGCEWGDLPLPKTTIPQELHLLKGFMEYMEQQKKDPTKSILVES